MDALNHNMAGMSLLIPTLSLDIEIIALNRKGISGNVRYKKNSKAIKP
jgi:acyl CoA:acetate/3-ketoacid CoA transferase alpha subunit